MKYLMKKTVLGSAIACVCCNAFAQQHDPTHHLTLDHHGKLKSSQHEEHTRTERTPSHATESYTHTNNYSNSNERSGWILRGGVAGIAIYPEKNKVRGSAVENPRLTTKSDYTGALSLTYITDNSIGIELASTLPFSLSQEFSGDNVPHTKFDSLKYQQTTLTAQYYFTPHKAWNPYVGLGAAYNSFEPKLGRQAKQEGYKGKKATQISPVIQAGMDYNLNEDWLINASLAYSRMTAKSDVSGAGTTREIKYDFNPFIARINIGWRF